LRPVEARLFRAKPGFFAETCREAHLSAEQTRPQAPSRLSQAHVHQKGPPSHSPPPRPGAQEAGGLTNNAKAPAETGASAKLALEHLRKRADFLRAQKGRRQSLPGLTLEICAAPLAFAKPLTVRVGFTASRKLGGAVMRNRAKRRLRAAAAASLPLLAREGHDYVLVARTATLSRPFAELARDLEKALFAAHSALARAEKAPSARDPQRSDRKEQSHG
jgi:ribonuclease P protein component